MTDIPTTEEIILFYLFLCAGLSIVFLFGMIVLSGVEAICKQITWKDMK